MAASWVIHGKLRGPPKFLVLRRSGNAPVGGMRGQSGAPGRARRRSPLPEDAVAAVEPERGLAKDAIYVHMIVIEIWPDNWAASPRTAGRTFQTIPSEHRQNRTGRAFARPFKRAHHP